MVKKEVFEDNRLLRDIGDLKSFFDGGKDKSFFVVEKLRRHFTCQFISPYHYHRYYEVYYLIEGCSTHLIGKNKYVLNQGEWIFVPCNVEHKVLYDTNPHERVLLSFSKDYISLSMLDKMNFFYSNPVYVPGDKDRESMDNIASKLVYEYKNPDKYSGEIYKNLLFELMVHFVRNPSNDDATEIMDLITEHTIDYIHMNYGKNITLEDIAELNGVSPSYMSRKFKSDTGVNISEYIRRFRIEQSKILLVETKYNISQISEKCGFADSNYFSYVFKKAEKISPLRYRKAYSKI